MVYVDFHVLEFLEDRTLIIMGDGKASQEGKCFPVELSCP